ncbi:MAG: PEP-CTERM sorting domain-containing protein [bacterium]|nr:PEP-CTERM sorting domain-containing protein [bacterium]
MGSGTGSFSLVTTTTPPVPEPGTVLFLAAGLVAAGVLRRSLG